LLTRTIRRRGSAMSLFWASAPISCFDALDAIERTFKCE
jgi:hypothetical protein